MYATPTHINHHSIQLLNTQWVHAMCGSYLLAKFLNIVSAGLIHALITTKFPSGSSREIAWYYVEQ